MFHLLCEVGRREHSDALPFLQSKEVVIARDDHVGCGGARRFEHPVVGGIVANHGDCPIGMDEFEGFPKQREDVGDLTGVETELRPTQDILGLPQERRRGDVRETPAGSQEKYPARMALSS